MPRVHIRPEANPRGSGSPPPAATYGIKADSHGCVLLGAFGVGLLWNTEQTARKNRQAAQQK